MLNVLPSKMAKRKTRKKHVFLRVKKHSNNQVLIMLMYVNNIVQARSVLPIKMQLAILGLHNLINVLMFGCKRNVLILAVLNPVLTMLPWIAKPKSRVAKRPAEVIGVKLIARLLVVDKNIVVPILRQIVVATWSKV